MQGESGEKEGRCDEKSWRFFIGVLGAVPLLYADRSPTYSAQLMDMASLGFGLTAGVAVTTAIGLPMALYVNRRTSSHAHRLAQRARGAERLAELGRLTGGLAHEIKNPLSTVNLNLQLVQEDLRDLVSDGLVPAERMARVQKRTDALGREVSRLREILEDFLRFAGRVKLDPAPVDAHRLIEELIDFYQPQAHAAKLRVRTQWQATWPMIHADATLLKQAILNLVINATHAMTQARQETKPHGGCDELILRSERKRIGDRQEFHIHVIDTGPGIAGGEIENIFQPYYSTKKSGTGLGLPTARRIIEEHGGTLTVHSEPGRGSDFEIALPVDRPAAETASA